jgi:hypothetical protein
MRNDEDFNNFFDTVVKKAAAHSFVTSLCCNEREN